MANTGHVKKLDELLQPLLDRDMKIVESSSKPLLSAGENYGSLMLAIQIKIRSNGLSKEDVLNLVAKMCPPNNWLKEVFSTAVTFKKEIAVYKTIFPTLKAFQTEQGVSKVIQFSPDCYGTRLSLDPNSEVVDDDAVILLENLKLSGFEVVDRMKGFDLETTELLLKDLAVFHALPVALKLLKPDVFSKKILPHLIKNQIFDGLSEQGEQSVTDFIVSTAKLNQECVPLIPNIIRSLKQGLHYMRHPLPACEPFSTINHNDFWANNTLIRFENNKPVQNKIIDFQLIDYGSPANDVIFFLFGSVKKEVLDEHIDKLIKLYYDTFIVTLKDLKCDTTPFTFERFQEEIDLCGRTTKFFHVVVMLRHIYALKDKVKELSEMTEEDLVSEKQVSDKCRQRIIETILYFSRKKWI